MRRLFVSALALAVFAVLLTPAQADYWFKWYGPDFKNLVVKIDNMYVANMPIMYGWGKQTPGAPDRSVQYTWDDAKKWAKGEITTYPGYQIKNWLGKGDWRLPTGWEMCGIWNSRSLLGYYYRDQGWHIYWTSTGGGDYASAYSWYQDFEFEPADCCEGDDCSSCRLIPCPTSEKHLVRAVRSVPSTDPDAGLYDPDEGQTSFQEGFDNFDNGVRPSGWSFSGVDNDDTYTTKAGIYGRKPPSLRFFQSGQIVTSCELSYPKNLYFWARLVSPGPAGPESCLRVEQLIGSSWLVVKDIYNLPNEGTLMGPCGLSSNATRVRFSFSKETGGGNLALDDVAILCYKDPPKAAAWYLPAGGVQLGGVNSETWIMVSNFDTYATAKVNIEFRGENGLISSVTNQSINPRQRLAVKMSSYVSDESVVATIVCPQNNVNVVAERSIYWPRDASAGNWTDGNNAMGTKQSSTTWYFAEGATHQWTSGSATHSFNMYVHVLNPGTTTACGYWEFVNNDGNEWTEEITLPGGCASMLRVNDIVGSQGVICARLIMDQPVVAERTMYYSRDSVWKASHASIGAPSSASEWTFAEGATHSFDMYVMVYNPSATQANVTFAFRDNASNTWTKQVSIPANERCQIEVNNEVGDLNAVSTEVESNVPVVAERSMYWPKGGPWEGAHNTVGLPGSPSKITWYFAEGSTKYFNTYITVYNPSATTSTDVTAWFWNNSGSCGNKTITIAPLTRATLGVNNIVGEDETSLTTLLWSSKVPVVAERSMYWPKGGPSWTGGHSTVGYAQ